MILGITNGKRNKKSKFMKHNRLNRQSSQSLIPQWFLTTWISRNLQLNVFIQRHDFSLHHLFLTIHFCARKYHWIVTLSCIYQHYYDCWSNYMDKKLLIWIEEWWFWYKIFNCYCTTFVLNNLQFSMINCLADKTRHTL